VIPGRGAPRDAIPGLGGERRRRGVDLPPTAAPRPAAPRRGLRFEVALPVAPPELDAALLMPGVVASAPDFDRPRPRPDEYVRPAGTELVADLLAPIDMHTEELRAMGRVDELPVALVSNPRPAYPALLERAQVGGRVVVEFRIDSVGDVMPGSLQVVESSDTLFTQAVRAVMPRLRFRPAQLDRQAVGVTVRQPFLFRIVARR
jgi:TonB family protein